MKSNIFNNRLKVFIVITLCGITRAVGTVDIFQRLAVQAANFVAFVTMLAIVAKPFRSAAGKIFGEHAFAHFSVKQPFYTAQPVIHFAFVLSVQYSVYRAYSYINTKQYN